MKRNPAESAVAGELVRIAVGNAVAVAVAVAAVAVHSNVDAWYLVAQKTVVVADHSIASVEGVPPVFVVEEQLELKEEMGKILVEYFLLLVEEESKLAEEPVKK